MLKVGLTGSAGSGKSTVARVWGEAGVPVVSADDLSRIAVEPGRPALAAIRAAFGDEIVGDDGTLDRARLRSRVFGDEAARRRLEEILHPRIAELRDDWMRERENEGVTLALAEIPLLFETGGERDFDVTVFVDAPREVLLARLAADTKRGLGVGEAERILAVQMDPAEKRRRADHVVVNDGSLETLRERALALLAKLRGRSGAEDVGDGAPGSDASGAGAVSPRLLRLDLHLHTWASRDCLSDPERVLATARARGVERLAVTDHDKLGLALQLAARYPDQVIPGEEVRTAEGIDMIGLYLHEEIPRRTPAREVIERVRAQGGVVYLPHPYAPGKGGGGKLAEELAPLVDVVEVFNARLHPGHLNEPAVGLAERHGRLKGAGSDAHMPSEVAGAYVEVPHHANEPKALLKALASGRIHGRMSHRAVHLASTWAKVRKRLPGAAGGGDVIADPRPFHEMFGDGLVNSPSEGPPVSYSTSESRQPAVAAALEVLLGSRRAVLTTHLNADGDGAGSEAALCAWLRANGNQAYIVNPTPFPDPFRFLLPDGTDSWVLPAGTADAREACERADLAVVLDTGEVPRIGRLKPMIEHLKTLVVDHHPPGDQAIGGVSFRDSAASATGELVFDLVHSRKGPWPQSVLEGIYVAILTDTGGFRFSNSTPGAHRVIAELVERGVDPERIHAKVYGRAPVRRFQLLREALATLEADQPAGMAWMVVPDAAFQSLGATPDDLEGLVDYPRSIDGVEVGLLFRQISQGTKISFRSNGPVDVNVLARQFTGGGHVRASGALVEGGLLADVMPRVISATREAIRTVRAASK